MGGVDRALASQSWRQPTSESRMAMLGRPSRILAMQRVSQVSELTSAIGRNGLLCKCIELAIARVTFDRSVEPISVERFEPRAKSRQLPRGLLLDGFFDVFGGCHPGNITSERHSEKACQSRLDYFKPVRSPAAARR